MYYTADLHVHSYYSRATSKNLNLESLYQWAHIKGIHIVGTGDFTHPQWFLELQEKLISDGKGFFRLKNPPEQLVKCRQQEVRFCLTTEISSIYKQGDRVRKNHNLLYASDFATVAKINARLGTIGNLTADGRPILGLSARDLLEMMLEISEDIHLIPAHIWTPWFSTLGSKSGYDSIEACFRDLTDYIFALETGLSSDPAMNWRCSALDRYTLISNSDAHSPQKLGREVNLFDTEMSYEGMFTALKTKKGFLGTLEFFPEEGKYHLDGHRQCGVYTEPRLTQKYRGICPSCSKRLTIGVLHRVVMLADRPNPYKPMQSAPFEYIIPLPEIISEIQNVGPHSKKVIEQFMRIIAHFGNEFYFLHKVPLEDIQKQLGPIYREAIYRLRQHQVFPQPGYDGLYGTIRIFQPGEMERWKGQLYFLEPRSSNLLPQRSVNIQPLQKRVLISSKELKKERDVILNPLQKAVERRIQGVTLVKAGPGTGKTATLIHWIISCIEQQAETQILAITFTNKAANTLKERLKLRLGDQLERVHIGTFHAIGYYMLKYCNNYIQNVYDAVDRCLTLAFLFPNLTQFQIDKISKSLSYYWETSQLPNVDNLYLYEEKYKRYLTEQQAVDLSGIIQELLHSWSRYPEKCPHAAYDYIAIDELQDINPLQYQFICRLGKGKHMLAIGDPDQSIYRFRGSDIRLFFQFQRDFQAEEIVLTENYRTTKTILQAATALMQHNTNKSGLVLTTKNQIGAKIHLCELADVYAEATYIVSQIKNYIGGVDNLALGYCDEGRYTFSDIAVLFRTKRVGKSLFSQLKKTAIPSHFNDGTSFLSDTPFCILKNILLLYMQPTNITALRVLLIYGLQWSVTAVHHFLTNLVPLSCFPEQAPPFISAKEQHAYNSWILFYNALDSIMQKDGLVGVVHAILHQYIPDNSLEASQQLEKEAILHLAKEYSDVNNFLNHMVLSQYTDTGSIHGEGIHLLTFHAAKGLEFPIVFIIGAEEGITPIHTENNDVLEEERRLFYVALTRAKEVVRITYVKNRMEYGIKNIQKCSRFVSELPLHCMDRISRPIVSPGYKSKQLQLF